MTFNCYCGSPVMPRTHGDDPEGSITVYACGNWHIPCESCEQVLSQDEVAMCGEATKGSGPWLCADCRLDEIDPDRD